MTYLPPPSTLPPGSIVDSYRRDSGGMKQDQSTDQQLTEIISFCNLHGLILRNNYCDDAKSGGTVDGRDQFKAMIDAYLSPDGRPSGIILWNYARFARDIDDAQLHKINIRRLGIVIHSLNDQVPEGNYGRFVEFFIDMSNEEKRRQTSIDAKRGLRDLVQKYCCVPGTPPRGFMREPVHIGERRDKSEHVAHKWVPDPAFKTRVRKAFQMRAQGQPLKLIHAETQLFGSSNSYLTFFTNPLYKGELHYSDLVIPNYCKPMVTKEIWDKVQVIIKDLAQKQKTTTSKRHPRRQSGVYILSGISKCGVCGSPHYGLTSNQRDGSAYLRYACTRAQRRHDCNAKPISASFLEQTILDKVHQFFSDPQNLINVMTAFQEDNSNHQTLVDEELASTAAQLGPVRKAITNLTNAIAESGHTPALLKRLKASEAQETELLAKIEKLKTQIIPPIIIPTIEQARAAAHKIDQDLRSKDREFVHRILLGILHEVIATREKHHIYGTITFFHQPPDKKKGTSKTVSLSSAPVGAPLYRHSISFEADLPIANRRHKRPRS
jgi:DNA invertase Pin-like site-specific DNA recombinase